MVAAAGIEPASASTTLQDTTCLARSLIRCPLTQRAGKTASQSQVQAEHLVIGAVSASPAP